MGGTSTKQEIKAKSQEQITENTSGVHLIEIHANSMGIGMFTILLVVALIGCLYIMKKKCVPRAHHDDYDVGRRSGRQRQRQRRSLFDIDEEDFDYRRSYRHDRQPRPMDLNSLQIEAIRSLMTQQHVIPFPQSHRHFEEMEMEPPTQVAQVHRQTRIDPPALTARRSSRQVIGATRPEITDLPAE